MPEVRPDVSSPSTRKDITRIAEQAGRGTYRPICIFHSRGYCRTGPACRYRHEPPTTRFSAKVRKRKSSCQAVDSEGVTAAGDQPVSDCGICFENPGAKKARYGLLTSCNHLFCMDCITKWRTPAQVGKDGGALLRHRKTCPLCRERSNFVVPSFDFKVGDEKAQAVDKFLAQCAEIPCKLYRESPVGGSCPFGVECFYMHVRDDGSVVDKDLEREEGGKSAIPRKTKALRAERSANAESNLRATLESSVLQEIVGEVVTALGAVEREHGVVDGPANRLSADANMLASLIGPVVSPIPDNRYEDVVNSLLSVFAESAAAAAQSRSN
jgi:hypothetical protein